MNNEFFERSLKIRSHILNNPEILARASRVFESHHTKGALPQGAEEIGRGDEHAIYSIGSINYKNQLLWLALRLGHMLPPLVRGETYKPFLEDLDLTEMVARANLPTVSFQLALARPDLEDDRGYSTDGVLGIVTEDLTSGGSKEVVRKSRRFYHGFNIELLELRNKDGKLESYFIDPCGSGYEEEGKKYLLPEAVIDLRGIN